MTRSTPQQNVEDQLRELLTGASLPHPDDVAHLERAVVFLWYDSKAFLLVDLDEAPQDDPLAGLDLNALEADIRGWPLLDPLPFTGTG